MTPSAEIAISHTMQSRSTLGLSEQSCGVAEAMRTILEGLGAKRVSVVLTNSERDESGVQEYYQPSAAAPRGRKKAASPLSKISAIRPRPRA